MNPEAVTQLVSMIREGNSLSAIQHLRQHYDMGLWEAKQVLDKLILALGKNEQSHAGLTAAADLSKAQKILDEFAQKTKDHIPASTDWSSQTGLSASELSERKQRKTKRTT